MGKELTKEDKIIELLELLSDQNMQEKLEKILELCNYVDSIENKLNHMNDGLQQMKQSNTGEIKETFPVWINEEIHVVAEHLSEQYHSMKIQIKEIKDEILAKATDITEEVKKKGNAALYRVSEFMGVKEKLQSLKTKVQNAKADVEHTIGKLEEFGKGMRQANRKIANTVRVLFEKETIDYRKKEQKFSKTKLLLKPWKGMQSMLESIDKKIDSAMKKVEGLQVEPKQNKDVEKKEQQVTQMGGEGIPMSMAAEQEMVYGADRFEKTQKEKKEKMTKKESEKKPIEKEQKNKSR